MSTETGIILSSTQRNAAVQIDALVRQAVTFPTQNKFELMMFKAEAIKRMEDLITPEIMANVMNLQKRKIGFLSDKTYAIEIVKPIFIEATLTGLEPLGNQFNIISEKMYVTKEGFTALLSKVPNLWQEIEYGLPKLENNSTTVTCSISWRIGQGEIKKRDVKFPVRVNQGMGNDAILGKAERKAKKWLYLEITGNDVSDGDITQDGTAEVLSSTTLAPEENSNQTSSSSNGQTPASNNDIEEAVVVSETIDHGVPPEDVVKYNEFIGKSEDLASLETRWANVLKRFPSFPNVVYLQIKQKYS